MAKNRNRKPLSTQVYVDPTAQTLTVITPTNETLLSRSMPNYVTEGDRESIENWARTILARNGYKTRGYSRDYPYGFLFNVTEPSGR